MPNQRACIPCTNGLVSKYMRDRFAQGVSLNTVSAELHSPKRLQELGYNKPPGTAMLANHIAKHMAPSAVSSTYRPDFSSVSPAVRPLDEYVEKDIARTIQTQALEMLQKGEMRLSATHALRAQEMLDRRVEKQRDREMQVLLARVLTRHHSPPSKYVGPDEDVIEGVAVEVTA